MDATGRKRTSQKLWSDAKRRAGRRGLPFAIKVSDIDIPRTCPVFGIPLFKGTKNQCDNSPTLDRILPGLGYVPGNIVVVSNLANRIKTNATPNQIYKVASFYERQLQTYYNKG